MLFRSTAIRRSLTTIIEDPLASDCVLPIMEPAKPVVELKPEKELDPNEGKKESPKDSGAKNKKKDSSGKKYYTVKSGDSLSTIAHKHKTTVTQLKKLNQLKGDVIHPGDKLRVK